ncbi:hypothetical protein GUITHDRAFT_108514 [Guillardia theta CCMP2712]|uniref:Testis-expressed sequence 9 protein n=1 Tax=Guillardia theta (strain CCMP2712) TaxID=905079 RepID=L1JBD9_GUITC|nr:hypothetical protein GUITHDRAFT_108514 [Guillardia theta CCMP2712]EKX45637.1 hypothetical protein GUITHDRAFT_108514 [Guillardia theta CCMP2712]|eukprot:XP_005832617.1 hypothetical protein GUITHDRAFT_108514 [Guillardia theta CCMP2712]
MAGMERIEREEMLRKRSEEADMRRTEALRMAQSVVMQQEAKLLSSPAANRSHGSRKGHDSAGSSPAKSSTHYSTPTKKKHLEDDDYDEQAYEDEDEDRDEGAAFGNEDFEVEEDYDAGGGMAAAAESQWRSRAQQASKREGDDDGHVATPQMGSEATIRYLKAKLKVMEEEVSEANQCLQEQQDRLTYLEKRNQELEESSTKSSKLNESLKVKLEKVKQELQDKTKLAESLERQLSASIKEKETIERAQKQNDSLAGAKDVRLNRALEEVERYKKLLAETKTSSSEVTEQVRKQLDAAVVEKKKLAKQKAELISGFKSQMKLIDVLKRQVIHLQAAKTLAITEQEFTKALELGDSI